MIRCIVYITIFIIGLCINTGCSNKNPDKNPEYILKLGHLVNENDIWHRSSQHFADLVSERSNGRMEVRVYPAEQLGKEHELIRSIKAGIVDMTITGETMQNWTPVTAFCAMPYLIRDFNHLKQVVEGPVGHKISDAMITTIGLRPLAHFPRGARNLTSNRPIKHPDDLKGIILRVPNVPIFVQTWYALGAKPTPMTFSEVFTALQQGTVEAQENPFSLIYSAGFYEVQKYVNLTEHVIGWVYVVIGEAQFQQMPGDLQKILIQAGKDMEVYHQNLFLKEEQHLKEQLQAHGMKFIETDKAAFRRKARAAVMELLAKEQLSVYKQIEQIQ